MLPCGDEQFLCLKPYSWLHMIFKWSNYGRIRTWIWNCQTRNLAHCFLHNIRTCFDIGSVRQVASLKRQLEFSQSQLSELHKVNADLQHRLHSDNYDRVGDGSDDATLEQFRKQVILSMQGKKMLIIWPTLFPSYVDMSPLVTFTLSPVTCCFRLPRHRSTMFIVILCASCVFEDYAMAYCMAPGDCRLGSRLGAEST